MMLELSDVSISYGETPLLEHIHVEIPSGRITTLLGASGSGKTLCALCLQGLLPPNLTQTSGHILLDKVPLDAKALRLAPIISILQHPRTCFNPLYTMENHIQESLKAWGEPYDKHRTLELFQQVHLEPSVLARYAFEMSGGMLQRVMIVIALLRKARFLIADEPTSDLDAIACGEFLRMIEEVCRDFALGVLLITHDMRLMQIAHRGYHIESKRVIRVIMIEKSPIHHRIKPIVTKASPSKKPFIKTPSAPSSTTAPLKPPLIALHNISKDYGAHRVLDDFCLTIHKGEKLAIIGRSGSGKSTLARILARLESYQGHIIYPTHWLQGRYFTLRARRNFYRHLQLLFQDPLSALNPHKTIYENLVEGLIALYRITNKHAQQERLLPLLASLHLDASLLAVYPSMISGGQAARINLARALLASPELLILDENTSCLDHAMEEEIWRYVSMLISRTYHTANNASSATTTHTKHANNHALQAAIFITHNLPLARAYCDRLVLVDAGKIVEIIPSDKPFTSNQGMCLESSFF